MMHIVNEAETGTRREAVANLTILHDKTEKCCHFVQCSSEATSATKADVQYLEIKLRILCCMTGQQLTRLLASASGEQTQVVKD